MFGSDMLPYGFVRLDISGLCHVYGISRGGEIYSSRLGRVLRGSFDGSGSFFVSLLCLDGKLRKYFVSKLVVRHFMGDVVGNINYLDGNKRNCSVYNLTVSGRRFMRTAGRRRGSRAVIATDKLGNEYSFDSVSLASKGLSVWRWRICSVLKGEMRTTGGYSFRLRD
jgi:hypothetical protein